MENCSDWDRHDGGRAARTKRVVVEGSGLPATRCDEASGTRHGPTDGTRSWAIQDESVRTLTSHSHFEPAMLASAGTLVELQRDNWVFNRVINDRGQYIAVLTMLDLHLSGGGAGFALRDLRRQASIQGFGSPNRATALAGTLRSGGFLAPVPAADLRMRKLAPTAQLVTLYRQRFSLQMEAQALLRPQIRAAIPAIADPTFMGHFIRGQLTAGRSSLRETPNEPGFDALAERANALVMLYAIVVAETRGTALVTSELARSFAVARSHVASVMKEAEAAGLIAVDPVARSFRPTERLRRALSLDFAVSVLTDAKALEFAWCQQPAHPPSVIAL